MRFRRRRPPIVELLSTWSGGPLPELPDEPPDDGRTIRWSAGALDGVVARHGDATVETERGAALAELIEHAATGTPDARRALYEAARAEGIVFALDEALDALARSGVPAEPVAELARRMAGEALHREPLKLAISLLGRAGDERDVGLLETVARHDEFSLVAGVALASVLDDPVQAWWRVGCLASGWGRVEAVGRLADMDEELPDDVRGWLLRARLPYRRAAGPGRARVRDRRTAGDRARRAGRRRAARRRLRDPERAGGRRPRRGHGRLRAGPARGGGGARPAGRPPAERRPHVGHRRPAQLGRGVRAARGDRRALRAPARPPRGSPVRGQATRAARTRCSGYGASPSRWASTHGRPAGGTWRARRIDAELYFQLARTPSGDRWARLVAHAERALPLDALAAGPEDRLLPTSADGEAAHALAHLVQEMRAGRWSAPLVATALLSPVIFIRNGALRALEQTKPTTGARPCRPPCAASPRSSRPTTSAPGRASSQRLESAI